MKNNTQLFKQAKHVYMNPTEDWKQIARVIKNKSGVYALVNKTNGKIYIGSSNNLYFRLRDYYANWYIANYPNLIISKAIVKYGLINFAVLILELTEKDDVLKTEQKYLDIYIPEYNILKTAGRSVGYKHTKLTREKIQVAHGNKVEITNVKNNEKTLYPSIIAATKAVKCSKNTILKYNELGTVYDSRYLFNIHK